MGFILGPICEKYLRRGLMMSKNDFTVFLTRPISGTFLVLAIAMILATLIAQTVKLKKSAANRKK